MKNMKSATVNSIVPQALVLGAKHVLPAFIVQVGLYPFLREAILIYLLSMGVGLNTLAQNSMVGDGFGGRLWYNPTNYTVGSYSGYSICTADDCSGTNQLYGWGANNYGQLGYSSATTGFDVPTAIPNMTDVKYYSCGYSMAAIKNDNTGWVWGQYTPNYYPTQVITDVKFADGGMSYCSFVKNDGTVWSIGHSAYGEFGSGTQTESALVPVQMQGISNAVRVACGFYTTYVLLADGTVRSVGSNSFGYLGNGTFQFNSLTPVVVSGLNNIIDIKATTYFTLALSANGDVYAWGQIPPSTITNTPIQITSLANIVAISGCADGYHILALDDEKNCFAWGSAVPEAVGLPLGGGIAPTVVATDVIDIMAGEFFSYIVKSNGTLWAAGDSYYGSIWLNLANETYTSGPELYDDFVQLDPSLVPEACSVVSQIALSSYSCEDAGTVNVIVSGGQGPYQYNIGNGNQVDNVFTGLAAGEYDITITNAAGCESVVSAIVDDGGTVYPIASLGPNQQLCEGGTATLDAGNAGASYLWSTGQTTQNIDIADDGVYSVEVTLNGCTIIDEMQMDILPQPIVNLGNEITTCENSTTTLNAGNTGATYLWSTGQTTQSIDVVNEGAYSVEVTMNGCTEEDEVLIELMPLPVVNLGNDIAQCEGVAINIMAPFYNNANYMWSNGQSSQSIDVTESGYYSVIVDLNGCTAEDELQIDILPMPIVNLGDEITTCEGTTTTLNAGNTGATYLWSTGQTSQNIDVTIGGTYTVEVTMNGCTSEDQIQVEIIEPPAINLGADIAECEGEGINITAPFINGATYQWSTGQTTQSIDAAISGAYSVEILLNGCTAVDEIQIEFLENPFVNLGNDMEMCEGTQMDLSAPYYNGASYLWNTGQTSLNIEVTESGSYSLEINWNGCITADEIFIEYFQIPVLDLGNDFAQCKGEEILLEATYVEGASYVWSTGLTGQSIVINDYGTYWCMAINGPCVYSDSIQYLQPVYECVEPFHAIWVPNAFTPDNDGNNDVFGVYGGGISNKNFELSIYNRWGDRIWTTNQPDMKWTGNMNDGEYYVPDGVYNYYVRYRFDNTVDDAILKGHVTVIR